MESSIENVPISHNKSELDSDSFGEINPILLKIIEKYKDKINSISLLINVSEIIGYISFLGFLLILTIRLSENFNFSWLILLIPSLICLISFTFEMNMYLKLKDIFAEVVMTEEGTSSSLGSFLSYLCLNFGSLCLIVYTILLFLKLDGFIKNLNEIAIPMYMLKGIIIFYYIFIFPAFIKNKMILE